jgi:hypothetical protein
LDWDLAVLDKLFFEATGQAALDVDHFHSTSKDSTLFFFFSLDQTVAHGE